MRAEPVGAEDAELAFVEDPVQYELPCLDAVQRLGEQVGEEVHAHSAVPQDIGERVVLVAGALGPQHVVEEELVLVGGCEACHFAVGAVQDDLPQPAGLGVDVKRHGVPRR